MTDKPRCKTCAVLADRFARLPDNASILCPTHSCYVNKLSHCEFYAAKDTETHAEHTKTHRRIKT